MNQKFDYCTNHAKSTCCSVEENYKIRGKISNAIERYEGVNDTQTTISPKCLNISKIASCSYCDKAFSTGKSEGICLDFCEKWYKACEKEWLDPYLTYSSEILPFCTKDSLICSQISEGIDTASQFCEMMGYRVGSNDSLSENYRPCFMDLSVNMTPQKEDKNVTEKE